MDGADDTAHQLLQQVQADMGNNLREPRHAAECTASCPRCLQPEPLHTLAARLAAGAWTSSTSRLGQRLEPAHWAARADELGDVLMQAFAPFGPLRLKRLRDVPVLSRSEGTGSAVVLAQPPWRQDTDGANELRPR
jgi:hypothetical protein